MDRRKQVVRRGENIGEITTTAAGDRDLEPDPWVALEKRDVAPAPAGGKSAHQAGSAATNHDDIVALQLFRWRLLPGARNQLRLAADCM